MSTTWDLTIHLSDAARGEPGDVLTSARAVLTTPSGVTLESYGNAVRNPRDTPSRQIGEEISTARALRDLSDRLLQVSSQDISDVKHQQVRLVH